MVKIFEFANHDEVYDVVDDVAVFMRNHPIVYRKLLFPVIQKMQYNVNHKKENDPEACLGNTVDKAMQYYCKEYNLGSPANVFKKTDRGMIVNKLFSEELELIRQGKYK